MRHLVVVGDLLLDRDLTGTVERISPEAPVPVVRDPVEVERPGGAGLAALLAARCDRPVSLVTALGDDRASRRAEELLGAAGVRIIPLALPGRIGERVRIRAGGQMLLRLDVGEEAERPGALTPDARAAILQSQVVLVSDYGRGVAAARDVRETLAAVSGTVPIVWDPHPRGAEPIDGALVITPNRTEICQLAPHVDGDGLAATVDRARKLARRWNALHVCVTLGSDGAVLVPAQGRALTIPVAPIARGDPCGAGDAFAVAMADALADGRAPAEAAHRAVRLAADWVSGDRTLRRGTAVPADHEGRGVACALAARIRAMGGTVVATGGCFDVLHAGHVDGLRAARELGDCLIVCLNSDSSVRRLKGPHRPVSGVRDRVAVLRALTCVDAVAVFDEDTPQQLLSDLRPDIWAKGGDYCLSDMPEAPLVESWGGKAVVLPSLPGRSTTRIIETIGGR
jgi:D-beta-D-heptose 7-phosphate kinase / D-beta-D-heptose 1-phosphate adenosyltransferase